MFRKRKTIPANKRRSLQVAASFHAGMLMPVALLFTLFSFHAAAQPPQILKPQDFIAQVRQYHPVARQAGIGVEMALASLQAARGSFDPSFQMNWEDKTFAGVNYYRYANPELSLPTAAGVRFRAGVENAAGDYANPELTSGTAGYAGVEISLLRGLLIDKQRAALQQAKIFTRLSRQEQADIINNLLLDSYDAYWQWAGAFQLLGIYQRYLDVAQQRMDLVNIAFRNGDRSVADTVEAYTQWQYIRMLQADAAIMYNNKYYGLSLFLWDSTSKPYLLSDIYLPDTSSFGALSALPPLSDMERLLNENHPALSVYRNKLEILEVERRLKFQNLLPSVVLGANVLSKEYFGNLSLGSQYLENNYKFGISIRTPLLFRQGRGEYKMAKWKITENNLQQSLKAWDLQRKLKQYHRETDLYAAQIQTALQMRENNRFLLRTEELRFGQGESSLFLINSREIRLLDADQKVIELRVKYFKSLYSAYWAAGQLR